MDTVHTYVQSSETSCEWCLGKLRWSEFEKQYRISRFWAESFKSELRNK